MRKIFLITIWLFSTSILFAQQYHPFVKEGAIWFSIFAHYELADPVPDMVEVYRFAMKGDTVYNGLQYKKLFRSYPPQTGESFMGMMREDSLKRVFFRGSAFLGLACNRVDTAEILLYQFGLKLNDSITLSNGIEYQVTNVQVISVNSQYRKAYTVTGYHSDWWIEGIGSQQGLFFPYCWEFESTYQGCYQDSEITNRCIATGQEEPSLSFQVFPNPFSKVLNLTGIQSPAQIYIYDPTGKNLFEQKLESSQVDLSNLNKGLYILRVEFSNGLYFVKKLVKIN